MSLVIFYLKAGQEPFSGFSAEDVGGALQHAVQLFALLCQLQHNICDAGSRCANLISQDTPTASDVVCIRGHQAETVKATCQSLDSLCMRALAS